MSREQLEENDLCNVAVDYETDPPSPRMLRESTDPWEDIVDRLQCQEYAESLRENRMLIYNTDIDDMLDDLAFSDASCSFRSRKSTFKVHFHYQRPRLSDCWRCRNGRCYKRRDSVCAAGDGDDGTTFFTRHMETRAPTNAPEIPRFIKLCNGIQTLLKTRNTEAVFEILIRSVKVGTDDATMSILKELESGQNLFLECCREEDSTASLLHVALLHQRTDICKQLISKYPGLLKVKYTSKEYRDQTCFHIAAAINDESGQIMQFMLENLPGERKKHELRELLNTIADGSYFVKERPGAATCLSAAVWSGKVHMISTLVNAGANLDLKSIDGNTLLHNIIYLSTTCLPLETAKKCFQEVYEVCNVWWARHNNFQSPQSKRQSDQRRYDGFCQLLRLQNDSGLIPAALAVSIHSPLTPFILSFDPIYKRTNVECGAVAWVTYDVTDILSYKQGHGHSFRQYDFKSVLHVLAHTKRVLSESDKENEQNDIAKLEPINSVIKMKWSVYRWLYILWCIIHATYMIALASVANYLHKNEPNVSPNHSYPNLTTETPTPINFPSSRVVSNNDVLNQGLFGLFLVIPVLYVIFELVDLLVCRFGFSGTNLMSIKHGKYPPTKRRLIYKIINYCTITGNTPYRLLAFSFAICIFTWYGMFICGNTNCDVPLSVALIIGWIFMLNFTRACRHVCRFTIMIQKMFFRDFLYFITVYVFILIAFSSALHLILPPGPGMENTVMGLLNILTNAGAIEEEGKPNQKQYAAALVSMYAILSVILLLNMLIAMMNTSYEAVKSSNTNLWRYQQLSILLLLERRFIWWGWLCRRSQSATKTSPVTSKEDERVYLDVTEEKMMS